MTDKQRSDVSQRTKSTSLNKYKIISKLTYFKSSENEAMDLALAYLTEHEIKPRMTLKEFAEMYGMELRQVQSDAERGYLPIAPRTTPGRRELKQVNMVAYYARMYLDGFSHLNRNSISGFK